MEQLQYFFLLLLLLAASYLLRKTSRKKKLRPPGPWRLPIIGNLHLLDPNKPHRSLQTLSLKHGPIMHLQLGSVPTLVISSHNIAAEIFRHHDLIFSGRPSLYASKKVSYNNSGIAFATYGEFWRQARRVTLVELLNPGRVRAFEGVRMEEVAKLVAAVRKLSGAANLTELTFSLTNNVVCRAAVGEEYGVGGYGGEGGVRLRDVLSETQRLLGGFWVADYFPAMGWVDRWVLRLDARLEKNFREIDKFCEKAIRGHLNMEGEKKSATEEQDLDGGDFLHSLLRLHKTATDDETRRGGFLTSIDHVKGILSDVYNGGTDTPASTITWTMAELIRNPRVMIKLQEELQHAAVACDHTVNKNSGELVKIIPERALEKLEYLKQVIKESLRLHTPIPLIPRETIEPCEIHGFKIPAKTRVLLNVAAISKDPTVWEKPLEFWPERFHGDGPDSGGQNFEFLPFGAGRRRCLGAGFSTVLIQLAVANLVHCFDWSMPDGMKVEDMNMDEAIGVAVHKKEPLRLLAKYKY